MAEQELSIRRVISYPRDVVFTAWTNAEELVKWFAPKGCTIIALKLDIREGGTFHWCIKNPKYPDCWCVGEFIRITNPSLIQYKIRLSDQSGHPISSQQAFKQSNWPEETLVTVSFNEEGNGTELIIKQTVSETLAKETGAYRGWIEMLDVLQEHLASVILNSKA
jgi:uncharacterized protein YndB with AHSA1/START domain